MFIAAATEIGKDSLFVFVRLGQDPRRGLKGAEKKGPPTDLAGERTVRDLDRGRELGPLDPH